MYYSLAALLPASCLSPTACELVAVAAHICLVSSLVACCCVDLRIDDRWALPTRASAVNSIYLTAQLLFVSCILHALCNEGSFQRCLQALAHARGVHIKTRPLILTVASHVSANNLVCDRHVKLTYVYA